MFGNLYWYMVKSTSVVELVLRRKMALETQVDLEFNWFLFYFFVYSAPIWVPI